MSRSVIAWLAGLAVALASTAHAAPVPGGDAAPFKPTVTVRLAPPDKILDDIRYAATLISRFAPSEKEGKEVIAATDTAVNNALGPDWRKAVDSGKPVLGYVTLDANLSASAGALMVPVKDEAEFRKTLTKLVGKLDDAKDGLLRFEFPGRDAEGKPLSGFLRFARQHAYLTVRNAEALALANLPTPEQVASGDPAAIASVHCHLDRLPAPYRQSALDSVRQYKSLVSGDMPAGTPWAMGFAQMVFLGPLMQLYPLAEPAVRDGRELTLDIGYDRKQLNLSFSFSLTAAAGSELEKLTRAVRQPTSLFPQLFGPETAARAQVRVTIPEEPRKALVAQVAAGIGQLPNEVPVWGQFAARIGEAVLPTLRDGELDLAAGLRGPYEQGAYGIIGGLRLRDAAAVEKAFRAAVTDLPKDARDAFVLDAGTVGGTKFHSVKLPPLPEPARSIFVENGLLVGFRPDAVIFAYGKSAMVSLQDGLAAKPQPLPTTLVEVSGKRLVPLVTKIDADAGKRFAAFLGTELDRVPLLEMTVEGGAVLKFRYGNGMTSLLPMGLFLTRAVIATPGPAAPAAVPARAVPPIR